MKCHVRLALQEGDTHLSSVVIRAGKEMSGRSNFANRRGQAVSHSHSLVVGLVTLVGILECTIIVQLILVV